MGNEAIKAIIWDMGGVILRSEDFTPRADLAARLGVTRRVLEDAVFQSPSAIQASLGEITTQSHWQNIAARFGLDEKGLMDFKNDFWHGDQLDEKLVAYIRNLKANYRTGLLSNAWSDTRKMLTLQHPCLDAFHEAIFSAEVNLMKPDPRIYHLILQKLKVLPEEAIFVDDFPENIEGANAFGIHGIQFNSREQAISEVDQLLS